MGLTFTMKYVARWYKVCAGVYWWKCWCGISYWGNVKLLSQRHLHQCPSMVQNWISWQALSLGSDCGMNSNGRIPFDDIAFGHLWHDYIRHSTSFFLLWRSLSWYIYMYMYSICIVQHFEPHISCMIIIIINFILLLLLMQHVLTCIFYNHSFFVFLASQSQSRYNTAQNTLYLVS